MSNELIGLLCWFGSLTIGTLLFIYVDPTIRNIFMSEKDRIMYDDTYVSSKFEKLKKRGKRWLCYVVFTLIALMFLFAKLLELLEPLEN